MIISPIRFSSVSHMHIDAENPWFGNSKLKEHLPDLFQKRIKEAYADLSSSNNWQTLANRYCPYSILLNSIDAIGIVNDKGQVIMFTGPESKLLAAASRGLEKICEYLQDKDNWLGKDGKGRLRPRRVSMHSMFYAQRYCIDKMNDFINSASRCKEFLTVFEGGSPRDDDGNYLDDTGKLVMYADGRVVDGAPVVATPDTKA